MNNKANTILLSIILLLSLANGCQTCTNKKTLTNIKWAQKSNTALMNSINETIQKGDSVLLKNITNIIEDNAEAGVIIEKEIDKKAISPTEVKEMFKLYRNYKNNDK